MNEYGGKMRGQFQWKANIQIKASSQRVWEIIDDISLIPEYHPEVKKVDLLAGQKKRAVGVKYQCPIPDGRKGSCIEEVIEYIPNQKMSTTMGEDSWGMNRMFTDFIVDTTVLPQSENSTILLFEAYYNPVGIKNTILNVLFLRSLMRKRTMKIMEGIKRLAEG